MEDKPLKNFVDCSVATAGEDGVDACVGSFCRLIAC
jgi:hypothetical protein